MIVNGLAFRATGQTHPKTNPIIYADVVLGYAAGDAGGFTAGATLNYQVHRTIFSFRFIESVQIEHAILSPLFPFPYPVSEKKLHEFALSYGRRFIKGNRAYSFSLGFSQNVFKKENWVDGQTSKKISTYPGVPFEANMQLFKAEKRRFRIYGLIPVGKPTALGGSLGLKLFGNISKNNYAGVGLTYGLGWHKKY
jgi:hypothetical protein